MTVSDTDMNSTDRDRGTKRKSESAAQQVVSVMTLLKQQMETQGKEFQESLKQIHVRLDEKEKSSSSRISSADREMIRAIPKNDDDSFWKLDDKLDGNEELSAYFVSIFMWSYLLPLKRVLYCEFFLLLKVEIIRAVGGKGRREKVFRAWDKVATVQVQVGLNWKGTVRDKNNPKKGVDGSTIAELMFGKFNLKLVFRLHKFQKN